MDRRSGVDRNGEERNGMGWCGVESNGVVSEEERGELGIGELENYLGKLLGEILERDVRNLI